MSRILVVTSGLTGIFNAATKLIALLKEAGNEVTSASPRQDIDTGNLPFIHVRLDALTQMSIIKIPGDAQLRGVGGILKKNFSRSKRRKVALEQIEPKDFLPLVQSFSPDLILSILNCTNTSFNLIQRGFLLFCSISFFQFGRAQVFQIFDQVRL